MRDPYLSNFDMKIGLLHGNVTLSGEVNHISINGELNTLCLISKGL